MAEPRHSFPFSRPAPVDTRHASFAPLPHLRRAGLPRRRRGCNPPRGDRVVGPRTGPARASVPPDAPAASTHQVTLVTGDVVTVTTTADGKQIAEVDRPDDAVGGVRMQESGGDLYVVPDEAVALLGADKLDHQLFNVTDLIEMGYDDAGTGRVPMIATYTPAKTRAAGPPAAPKGSKTVRQLPVIDGAAIAAGPAGEPHLLDHRRARARPDRPDARPSRPASRSCGWTAGCEADLAESVPQVGAPAAWAAGFDGTGVTVAVLDTGIDVEPPRLRRPDRRHRELRPRRGHRRRQRARHPRRLDGRRHRCRIRGSQQGRRARRRPDRSARSSAAPTATARTPGSSRAWRGPPSPVPTWST